MLPKTYPITPATAKRIAEEARADDLAQAAKDPSTPYQIALRELDEMVKMGHLSKEQQSSYIGR